MSITLAKKAGKKNIPVSNEEILILIEQNLALNEEVHRLTKRIHYFMVFNQVMFWIKFVIFIVLPLVLAFVYLPPALGQLKSLSDGLNRFLINVK